MDGRGPTGLSPGSVCHARCWTSHTGRLGVEVLSLSASLNRLSLSASLSRPLSRPSSRPASLSAHMFTAEHRRAGVCSASASGCSTGGQSHLPSHLPACLTCTQHLTHRHSQGTCGSARISAKANAGCLCNAAVGPRFVAAVQDSPTAGKTVSNVEPVASSAQQHCRAALNDPVPR